MNIGTNVTGITIPEGTGIGINSGIDVLWHVRGNVFVASWGDDTTGDGTVLQPVKTIGRADALAQNGDTITLLTDITLTSNLTLAHSVTLMGVRKSVELHLNRNVNLRFTSGTNEIITRLTISCDRHGTSDNDTMAYVILCPQSGTLTVENVLFDRCNDYDETQNYSRCGLLATNYRSGTLTVRNCEIRNSVSAGLLRVRSNYNNLCEHITVGRNVQVFSKSSTSVSSGTIVSTGMNESVKVESIGYISSESDVNLITLGYFHNTNTDVHHISGVGGILFGRHGSGRGILREIDLVGTLDIQKPSYIGGRIRGTLTVTDTYREAADGNVFFEGYNGYTITQEDFASMTWGGAAGYHLALENNKILLRADAA